jgi:hypothetical protein
MGQVSHDREILGFCGRGVLVVRGRAYRGDEPLDVLFLDGKPERRSVPELAESRWVVAGGPYAQMLEGPMAVV